MTFTQKKFCALPLRLQHKHAAEALREQDPSYGDLASYMDLPPVTTQEEISDRFHLHASAANLPLKEHEYLITTQDRLSDVPYLPIGIYLDNIRSAHNVGSIIRTTEALRLGTLYFSEHTPYIDNKKVIDTSMGCAPLVPAQKAHLSSLPGPLIALETAPDAPSLHSSAFPETFTLLLGNEEYGLSQEALSKADQIVQIPLPGSKNSLNVACAFAIVAHHIHLRRYACQLSHHTMP